MDTIAGNFALNAPIARGSPASPPIMPLQPESFGPVSGPVSTAPNPLLTMPQSGATGSFAAEDRVVLHTALALLRTARKDAGADDPARARSGRARMIIVISYLTGFFDSRGLLEAAPLNPGYQRLTGSIARPPLDAVLDDLEQNLTAMATEPDTRGVVKSVISSLGDVAIGLGVSMIASSIVL